ncbi:MAG: Ni/Fe hydrogenase subunit alpha [Nanoarchaeota archaeon]
MVKEINLNHICKIEGHAHLSLKIEGNKIKTCELKAAEGARFFEALVLGRNVEDIQEIVSRICGICSSAHTIACIQALENALGIKPAEQQKIIRELLMIGERIRSHVTHLYFFSLPDYFGFSSALEMSKKHREKIDNALSLISLGNKIVEIFGGREIHPFLCMNKSLPQDLNFKELIEKLEESKELIDETINLFSNLDYHGFERESFYLSLKDSEYATISGKIGSADKLVEVDDYKKYLQENIKEYATSKFVLQNSKPFMVGAISRINNNLESLDEHSKHFLKNRFPSKNPFHNIIAQAIELSYFRQRALVLLKKLNSDNKEQKIKIKSGSGISAVEAPRGTLFHEYKIDNTGKISYCNIITPTAQNLAMLEQDIKNFVEYLLEKNKKISKENLVLEIEKLIRAYDPCFSCSTHFLRVNWM